jgi:hypothetical protein
MMKLRRLANELPPGSSARVGPLGPNTTHAFSHLGAFLRRINIVMTPWGGERTIEVAAARAMDRRQASC